LFIPDAIFVIDRVGGAFHLVVWIITQVTCTWMIIWIVAQQRYAGCGPLTCLSVVYQKTPSVLRLANPCFLDVLGGRFTVLVNICFSDAISLTDRRSLASSGHDEASCHLCPRVC
jgi:hypothetical protein